MNRLHVVHHGVGGFRPLRALFLVLIGFLMGLGFAHGERGCSPGVWPKDVPLPQYQFRPAPSSAPAPSPAAPGTVSPR